MFRLDALYRFTRASDAADVYFATSSVAFYSTICAGAAASIPSPREPFKHVQEIKELSVIERGIDI
jgi:hypothetical protein